MDIADKITVLTIADIHSYRDLRSVSKMGYPSSAAFIKALILKLSEHPQRCRIWI